jgi:beta-glucosidase/6-phospho-beta-glucosidase/beta-galactosidase
MASEQSPTDRIDTSVAHPARRYDYLLGGKDNFEADRESARQIEQIMPTVRVVAQENRWFLHRAVRYLAEQGIRQFLDIGTGIPTSPNTHQIAQAIDPTARIVYADNDPVLLGSYPSFLFALLGEVVRDGDLDVISAPLDALGVNYYNPTRIGAPAADSPLPFEMLPIPGVPVTAFGWPVVPSGLYDLLAGLRTTYGTALPPIYVTENGCSTADVLDDEFRISYLDQHLRAVHRALADGIDVRGYFVWSLLDNFEWAEGYSQRFGLVRVDFATQERTPRSSYRWLRSALAGRAPR